MTGIASPRIRDRLRLAWLALTGTDRELIRDACQVVLYPLHVQDLFDDFYRHVSDESWTAAWLCISALERAIGHGDIEMVQARWAHRAEYDGPDPGDSTGP